MDASSSRRGGAPAGLPPLVPVLVAADVDAIEEHLRSERAVIARLSLRLRTVRHQAEVAEQQAATASVDTTARERALVEATLAQRLVDRRAAMAAAVAAAEQEAADLVGRAQARADEYVASAHSTLLDALLHPGEPLPPLPPRPGREDLAIAGPPAPASQPEARPSHETESPEGHVDASPADPSPFAPPVDPPSAVEADAVPPSGPAADARSDAPLAPAPSPDTSGDEPPAAAQATPSAPTVPAPPPPSPQLASPEALMGMASIIAAMQPYLAAAQPAMQTWAAAPAPVPDGASAVPGPTVGMAPPPPAAPPVPTPPLWSRLLFADVLLPLIAAVIVLIVLLAWVG